MKPQISVVIATRDRAASLARLLACLAVQTLDASDFEVIVVDDGSSVPLPSLAGQYPALNVQQVAISWSGQAVARHRGACLAVGDVLVFLDDDMEVPEGFLAAHLGRHLADLKAVVLGSIEPDPGLATMPLFERYHARQLDRWRKAVVEKRQTARGMNLCTGNVSLRRSTYFAVGGFNPTLKRSEDRELGIRLEKAGCNITYAEEARSVHRSDHASASVWLNRAYLYGRFDHRISALHPDVPAAHPWAFWPLINPASRPVVAISLVSARAGRLVSRMSYGVAVLADWLGARFLALTAVALCYALEYFAGLRDECGSFRAFWKDRPHRQTGVRAEFRRMVRAIRADHDAIRKLRGKYRSETVSASKLPLHLVQKVGFQMLAFYRLMRFLDACCIPLLPMVMSRLIRHWYSADIHWKTRIAPGVAIVHGIGLVLGQAAVIEEGCVLFHHVTMGENIDARSGMIGTPHLQANVHVGPGATLLGPITIGAGSKIGAGCVLLRSVLAGSLVTMPEPVVTARRKPMPRATSGKPALANAVATSAATNL